jgi:DNA polymerase III epsilon subunit-like protein
MTQPIAITDLETTGTDPSRHHVWEIAVVLRTDTGDTEYCWQIRPDLSMADPMALKISGYYLRGGFEDAPVGDVRRTVHPDMGLSEAPTVQEFAAELAWLLNGSVLAAANVAFDAAFLDRFLRANGQAPAWDYHLLEIESYAAGALGMEPPWKLDKLATELGVSLPEERHTALADARLARDVYDAARTLRGAR